MSNAYAVLVPCIRNAVYVLEKATWASSKEDDAAEIAGAGRFVALVFQI